jgi:hypothetical protein
MKFLSLLVAQRCTTTVLFFLILSRDVARQEATKISWFVLAGLSYSAFCQSFSKLPKSGNPLERNGTKRQQWNRNEEEDRKQQQKTEQE